VHYAGRPIKAAAADKTEMKDNEGTPAGICYCSISDNDDAVRSFFRFTLSVLYIYLVAMPRHLCICNSARSVCVCVCVCVCVTVTVTAPVSE